MPVRTSIPTRERIVHAMGELLRTKGYAGTSMKDLTVAAHAPIGSIYHHFPIGKPGVAEAAIRAAGKVYGELISLLDAPGPIDAAIENAFAAAAIHIESYGWINMCPVVTVGAEVADTEPNVRDAAADAFHEWINSGTALLVRRGLDAGDARVLITATITALEGAFATCRLTHSTEPMHAAGKAVAALARNLRVRTPRSV